MSRGLRLLQLLLAPLAWLLEKLRKPDYDELIAQRRNR